jgi:glutathione S-transferase
MNRSSPMAEYQLYCFAQSGNSYRVALMLNLIGADWQPVFVDFFAKGVPRTPQYRSDVNEMGEVPVLVHGARKLSQSGVCLSYLAQRSGKFAPANEDEQLETLRWLLFDKQIFLPLQSETPRRKAHANPLNDQDFRALHATERIATTTSLQVSHWCPKPSTISRFEHSKNRPPA